jgi:hypothetical protein
MSREQFSFKLDGYRVFIDIFSSLDDLPKAKRRDALAVLALLAKTGKFSCFEIDDALASALRKLERREWMETTHRLGYPWIGVVITDKGRAALATDSADER